MPIKLTFQNNEIRIFNSKQEYEEVMNSRKADIKQKLDAAKKLPKYCSVKEAADVLSVGIDVVHGNILAGHITTKFVDGRSLITKESLIWALRNQNFKEYKITKE